MDEFALKVMGPTTARLPVAMVLPLNQILVPVRLMFPLVCKAAVWIRVPPELTVKCLRRVQLPKFIPFETVIDASLAEKIEMPPTRLFAAFNNMSFVLFAVNPNDPPIIKGSLCVIPPVHD